jgi:AAHS family 4-hydroxybenzoate transporter-like MFS transporter
MLSLRRFGAFMADGLDAAATPRAMAEPETGLNRAHINLLIAIGTLQLVEGYDLVSMGLVASSVAGEWHLSPSQVGLVFGIQQLGSLAAAALAPLLSRGIGRKRLLIIATLVIAIGSALSAAATGYAQLLLLRLPTGLGLGFIATVAVPYAAEFFPVRHRGFVVSVLMSAINAGFVVGGIAAAFLIPSIGWRPVMIVGALAPPLMALVIMRLPQSPVEMRRRGASAKEIASICSLYGIAEPPRQDMTTRPTGLFSMRQIVALGRGWEFATAIVTNSCAGVLVYSLTNWLPSLVLRSGLSQSASSISSSALMAGGVVGCLGAGWLMDRFSPYLVLGTMFFFSAVALVLLSVTPPAVILLLSMCAVVGLFAMGAVPGTISFASITIPSQVRLESLGLVTMASRVAGLLAPSAAGFVLDAGGSNQQLFLMAASVALVGAGALAMSGLSSHRAGRYVRAAA